MQLTPGTRLGPYEILSPLGAGGMGEVYRARDTRLGRDVAVKVLPEHLSAEPEVRARFEREARAVSSLNHPHICTLHDVGREGETDYLVMELVEGETLGQRLERGALSAADVLRLGSQIADALDRAHRAGIVHRDLKPGNVMLTKAGAKLMDFGLARAGGAASGSGSSATAATIATLSQSPTMSSPLTARGTIVGTFQYMSPEQLEGRDADARSDIWSLGCVLYEMVTGKRAFEGRSHASLIAAILEREPAPISAPPPSSGTPSALAGPPPGIEMLIRNCLTKDPDERIQTAHDVKLQLRGIAESAGLSTAAPTSLSSSAASPAIARRGGNTLAAWSVAAVALLAAVGVHFWHASRPAPPKTIARFRLDPIPGAVAMFWPRVSPDGKYIAVVTSDSSSVERAYVRPLDQIEAHAVPGTEELRRPYWSPDSRELGFIVDGKLQRVPIAGGSPVTICPASGGADLSWGSKGLILIDGQATDSLRVVPAGGGELQPATRIERADGETGSTWPCFLPDGEHFLYIGALPDGVTGNIRLGKIGSLDSKLLGRSDGRAEYGPGGWVVFLREKGLVAQKLDLGAGKLTGQPITIADGIRGGSAAGHFSISESGILAYALENVGQTAALYEADRRGVLAGNVLAKGTLGNPRLSPNGRHLLYLRSERALEGGGDVYVLDLERGTDTRLTFTNGLAKTPQWSPDGARVAFVARTGAANNRIRVMAATGLGAQDSLVIADSLGASLSHWSASGSRLAFHSGTFHGFAASIDGADRTLQPLGDPEQRMAHPRFSPDGRYVAFAFGSLPAVHVYVLSLDGAPGKWQISTAPGFRPIWTRGGREIVYEGLDGRLMAVEVDLTGGFRAGMPQPLFALPLRSSDVDITSWACDENGERFFLVVGPAAQGSGIIEVVTDFHSLVSRK